MKIVIIALGTLASALALVPGQALARDSAAPVHVSYGDLNLRTAAGVRTLDRRLAQAVQTVCAEGATDLARQYAARRCVVAASARLASERSQVIATAATAALAARSGPSGGASAGNPAGGR